MKVDKPNAEVSASLLDLTVGLPNVAAIGLGDGIIRTMSKTSRVRNAIGYIAGQYL